MRLRVQIIPGELRGPQLVRDYLAGEGTARSFFSGSPFATEPYTRKWQEVRKRFGTAERARAAAALRPTSERAAQRLARFVEEGGAVVTTGQQAGLFTGPLYTIYKILTAVALAEALEKQFGILVLPVFWAASEDHDWEEANHAFVTDRSGTLRRLQLQSADPRPLPVSDRSVENNIESILEELAEILTVKGHDPAYLNLLRDAYRTGDSVGKAFREVVEQLFAPFDLLTTDAADPALKEASTEVMLAALELARDHEACVREVSSRLIERGYHAQVASIPGAANLFYHGEQGRERLHHRGEEWHAPLSRQVFTPGELEARLRSEPALFSPNVHLRPVVESAVFPTLAYVAGPGEISYFAQLGPLFDSYGLQMPVVYPRFSAVLIESAIQQILDELALDPKTVQSPRQELVTLLARRSVPPEVEVALAKLRSSVVEAYDSLIAAVQSADPALRVGLGTLRNRTLLNAAESERKILRQIKREEHDRIAQLDRVRSQLWPNDQPQDRALNLFSFLPGYPSLLQDLASTIRQTIRLPVSTT